MRGVGLAAATLEHECAVGLFFEDGDAAVIQAHGEDLVVLGCMTDDGIDGDEVAEDDGVVGE